MEVQRATSKTGNRSRPEGSRDKDLTIRLSAEERRGSETKTTRRSSVLGARMVSRRPVILRASDSDLKRWRARSPPSAPMN